MHEFHMATQRTKNSAPGPDGIFYQMLRNLPETAQEHLLKIINKFWIEGFFPDEWRKANVIALPKPGKDPSNPTNYRPIALTSNLGKTVERMINYRLHDFLKMNGILSNIQCGCQSDRSTGDHLVRLEASIRRAQVHNEHFITIFFDLKKAYDTTWCHGILRDLQKIGLRGRLPNYISQFLENRNFRVQINNHFSNPKIQEEGVPQGSVLSVTLFAIKINDLAKQLPNDPRLHTSLYVDDFQMGYSHSDLSVIQTKINSFLQKITKWTTEEGFTFSESKTFAMHFCKPSDLSPSPEFRLYGTIINYTDQFKFLGMIFDRKMTWKEHVQQLKTKCNKAINFIRSISSHKWGASQKILLHLYNIFIRSRLDYGCTVYQSATNSIKALLEPIQNECLRIASGAFKSTPVPNLQIICNQMPLEMRRQLLTLKYHYKMKSHIYNPAFSASVPTTDNRLFANKRITPPLAIRANDLINSENIPKASICPAFSYRVLGIRVPTWSIKTVNMNTELTEFPKNSTNPAFYRLCFRDMIHNNYRNFTQLYTDGSKTENGVGAAVVGPHQTRRASLPPQASIFTAELHAIELALNLIANMDGQLFVVMTDSLSTIQSLQDKNTKSPISRKLQHKLHDMSESRTIDLFWVPSHCGIEGNERADTAAREACELPAQNIMIHYRDMFPIVDKTINSIWLNKWTQCHSTLKEIKPTPGPWRERILPRREEVIIGRLRAQHTWLTHHHLMGDRHEPPQQCPLCNDDLLTVPHLLLECPATSNARRRYMSIYGKKAQPTLVDFLGDNMKVSDLMKFLKAVGAFELI